MAKCEKFKFWLFESIKRIHRAFKDILLCAQATEITEMNGKNFAASERAGRDRIKMPAHTIKRKPAVWRAAIDPGTHCSQHRRTSSKGKFLFHCVSADNTIHFEYAVAHPPTHLPTHHRRSTGKVKTSHNYFIWPSNRPETRNKRQKEHKTETKKGRREKKHFLLENGNKKMSEVNSAIYDSHCKWSVRFGDAHTLVSSTDGSRSLCRRQRTLSSSRSRKSLTSNIKDLADADEMPTWPRRCLHFILSLIIFYYFDFNINIKNKNFSIFVRPIIHNGFIWTFYYGRYSNLCTCMQHAPPAAADRHGQRNISLFFWSSHCSFGLVMSWTTDTPKWSWCSDANMNIEYSLVLL